MYKSTLAWFNEPDMGEEENMSLHIARQVLHQLLYGKTSHGSKGKTAMLCWGVSGITPLKTGISFNVNGENAAGSVLINYLSGTDTYEVEIYDIQQNLAEQIHNIYFMDLVKVIDKVIGS